MKEIWKDVPGYPGYRVSDLGRVFSTGRIRKMNKILKLRKQYGYLHIGLYLGDDRKLFSVHRLVMLAFHGPSSLTVNHKNKKRDDNRLCNLEYMTVRENIIHGLAETAWKRTLPLGVKPTTSGKYVASIYINHKHIHLGLYKTASEASKAYQERLRLL